MQHAQRYIWFDLIRGLSALAVCANHLRPAIMVDYVQLSTASIPIKLFYLASGFGHQAVVVFFVLSGFFVGGSVLGKRATFSWKSYCIARLTRLWVVLLPALLLTLVINVILQQWAPEALNGTYRHVWNSGPNIEKPFSAGFVTFIGNILFLQTIVVPVFGVNGPLWSLANEFWYYMLFPAGLAAFGFLWPAGKMTRVVYVLALVLGLVLLPTKITLLFIVWMFGVLLWIVRERQLPRFRFSVAFAGLVIFVTTLLVTKTPLLQSAGIVSDFAVGVAFTLFAFLLLPISTDFIGSSIMKWVAKWSSEISYSLYVTHFPLLIVIAAILYKNDQLQPNMSGVLQILAWMGFLVFAGWLSWFLFEQQTPKVRRWVGKKLDLE